MCVYVNETENTCPKLTPQLGTNEQFVAVVFITSTPFAKQHFFPILPFFDTMPTTQAADTAAVIDVILYISYIYTCIYVCSRSISDRRTDDVRKFDYCRPPQKTCVLAPNAYLYNNIIVYYSTYILCISVDIIIYRHCPYCSYY